MKTLKPIIIESKQTAEYAIIWLHGLGADGHDFEPVAPQLQLNNTRFIFPHAPIRPITLNGGMAMRAWFDITALSLHAKEDEASVRDSQAYIAGLIDAQVQQGIPASQVFLAGFSQGAAMALHTGLRYPQALAGIIALSSFLPLREKLATEIVEAQLQTPIFMAHGLYDMLLPYLFGEGGKKILESLGLSVEWHSYPIDHSVSVAEIADVRKFLSGIIENV